MQWSDAHQGLLREKEVCWMLPMTENGQSILLHTHSRYQCPFAHFETSSVMYTHVSSSFLCAMLRGLVHAPFPFVHKPPCFFCLQSVFHLSLSVSERTSLVIWCQQQDYTTNQTRARSEGERARQLVNNEKVDKFGLKFY